MGTVLIFSAELQPREIHDCFRLGGRIGRDAWDRCPLCNAKKPAGFYHACTQPFIAFWAILDDDAELFGPLSRGSLQRSAVSMSGIRGMHGPFDAAGIGWWLAAHLQ